MLWPRMNGNGISASQEASGQSWRTVSGKGGRAHTLVSPQEEVAAEAGTGASAMPLNP
jgi:hypothetical protein